jgi:Protein of unknown function (DUF732)
MNRLAWSETDPAGVVPYPPDRQRRVWWPAAGWAILGAAFAAGAVTGVLLLGHPAAPAPLMPPAAAPTVGAPVAAAPAVPTIPDVPDMAPQNGNPDTAFLNALRTGQTGWDGDDGPYIEWGHWVCASVQSGRPETDVIGLILNARKGPGVAPWTASSAEHFVAAAVHTYCPGQG